MVHLRNSNPNLRLYWFELFVFVNFIISNIRYDMKWLEMALYLMYNCNFRKS